MNLAAIDRLIEEVKNDKELFEFYTKKRRELVQLINYNIAKALR